MSLHAKFPHELVFRYCVGNTKLEINAKHVRRTVAAEGRGRSVEGDGFAEGAREKQKLINPQLFRWLRRSRIWWLLV